MDTDPSSLPWCEFERQSERRVPFHVGKVLAKTFMGTARTRRIEGSRKKKAFDEKCRKINLLRALDPTGRSQVLPEDSLASALQNLGAKT